MSVTIVTPSHNRAAFLPETIESVLRQEYRHIEYIVLDDGSTDDTTRVLDGYSGSLRWESHPNMGEARTVNKGLAMARGEIIGIVNSDDPILPGLVQRVVETFARDERLLAVYPDWVMIDHASKPVREVQAPPYDYLNMVKWQKCFIGPGAFIRRRALSLEPARNPGYRFIGDFEYWLRLSLHGPFARIPETLATHRVHPVSASAERGQASAQEHMRLVEEYFTRADLPPAVRRVRNEAYGNAAYLAARACMASSLSEAREYFLRSLRHDPACYLKWRPERLIVLLAAFLPARLSNRVRVFLERQAKSPMHYYGPS